ncbi:MAG TPA: LLM class flavin-dependent oxidoreductase [Acidimicrobiales bacterium]|nr:LLM class flavin-dependent oxidoreductase [Acidimicrobiales bacterium]
MRLGVSLAQTGRLADPAAIRSAATAAEQVGYSSVWVLDRLGAGGRPDLTTVLDPLTVLTYAAACTTRVALGTSVLVAPWYRPALLARSLSSLDVLSDGRLTVGLGLGASLDEFAAVGVPRRELGRRLDDALDVLDDVFSPASGAHRRPPVLLAASSTDDLDRVARRADGWNPSGLPVDMLAPMWATVRDLAAGHGRDPDTLRLVVRATIDLRDDPIDGDRAPYSGTDEQIAADLEDTRRAGADEVILGVECDDCLDKALGVYARVAEAVDVPTAA